jgi:hypothetical protein
VIALMPASLRVQVHLRSTEMSAIVACSAAAGGHRASLNTGIRRDTDDGRGRAGRNYLVRGKNVHF